MKTFVNSKNSHTYTHFLDNVIHTERKGELLTLYQDTDGTWYARPTPMFHGMRTTESGDEVKRFIEQPHAMRHSVESLFGILRAKSQVTIRQHYFASVDEVLVDENIDVPEDSEGFHLVIGLDRTGTSELEGTIIFTAVEGAIHMHYCKVTKSFEVGADPAIIALAHVIFDHFRVMDGKALNLKIIDDGYEVSGSMIKGFTETI